MRMIVPSGVTIIALYLSSGESSASFVGVVTWKDRPKPGVSENFVGARGARRAVRRRDAALRHVARSRRDGERSCVRLYVQLYSSTTNKRELSMSSHRWSNS